MPMLSPDEFLKACGASGPLRFHTENRERGQVMASTIPRPFVMIGRKPGVDLQLDDKRVSKRHAYLQVLGGRIFCIDLQSRTGTHGPAGPIQAAWLDSAQPLRIGPFLVQLVDGLVASQDSLASPADPTASGSLPEQLLPGLTLEISQGNIPVVRTRVNRMLTVVGTLPDCKIRLRDPSVSRMHCSLVCTRNGCWLVDLVSRTGVWINSERQTWARLKDGDELRIGTFTLRVVHDATSSDTPTLPAAQKGGPVVNVPALAVDGRGSPPKSEPTLGASRVPVAATAAGMPVVPAARTPATVGPTPLVVDGASMERVAFAQSLLLPFVQQFNLMQTQMFEQFQQVMLTMFQKFSDLHWGQRDEIQQELRRLQEITAELDKLQGELAQQSSARSATSVLPGSAQAPQVSTLVVSAGLSGAESIAPANLSPEAQRPLGSAATPIADRPPPSLTGPMNPQPAGHTRAPSINTLNSAPTGATAADSHFHDFLTERIAAIQAERQGRWQKILSFLAGNRP